MELFWQTMPGETVAQIDRQFEGWLHALVESHPSSFAVPPLVTHPIRRLPGSAVAPHTSLVKQVSGTVAAVPGKPPLVCGIEGPCDMFIFHDFGIPAIRWGPGGGKMHMSDEYVKIDSPVEFRKAPPAFVCQWCGVSKL